MSLDEHATLGTAASMSVGVLPVGGISEAAFGQYLGALRGFGGFRAADLHCVSRAGERARAQAGAAKHVREAGTEARAGRKSVASAPARAHAAERGEVAGMGVADVALEREHLVVAQRVNKYRLCYIYYVSLYI